MPQHILAIDDEPDLLRLIERIIKEKTSYQVTVTNNSLELPGLLKENEYDVIVTDLKMPGMDGLDVLKYVKDNRRSEQVIIITAFGSLDSATEAVSKGVFDYIIKPFRKEQILFTIDRAMRYQQAAREMNKLISIFETEPFTSALAAFEKEYVRRLLVRHNNDFSAAVSASGIRAEEVIRVMPGFGGKGK